MSNYKVAIDLTQKSVTFPDLSLQPLIPLEPKIRELQNKFNLNNQKIILKGSSGSGKTIHLAEFVKANPYTSFSYFFTDSYWCQRQTAFLSSLCQQMEAAIGGSAFDSAVSIGNSKIDLEGLHIIFENLLGKVIELAKKTNTTFYFVIDGLEWAFEGKVGERIIDLLPLQTNPKHLYFLGSISNSTGQNIDFEHLSEEPTTFSSLDTKDYFEKAGIVLSADLLSQVQKISGGVPGYLYTLRKLHLDGVQEIHKAIEMPSEVEELSKIQWKSISEKSSDDEKIILALMAYSVVPLSEEIITELARLEKGYVGKFLNSCGVVRQNKKGEWVFYPELIRKIAQNRLDEYKPKTIDALVEYYENKVDEIEASNLLSEYYIASNNYSGIETLINPSSINKAVSIAGGLGGVKKVLERANELAYQKSNKYGLLYASLVASQLRTLSNQVIGESEIKALIAMDEFDKALDLTYAIKLDLLRIRLLSKIYLEKEKDGYTLTKSVLDEFEQMIDNLDTENLDPQDVLLAAVDIFPILPDASTNLIDKLKKQENSQTAMDLIYALTSLKSFDATDEAIVNKIQDKNLQEKTLSSSPWLTKLSSKEVIEKSKKVFQTKTKEFLLREWCRQNKSDPNLHEVVEEALDVINSDTNYKIPLRNLRQLSDVLQGCIPEKLDILISRFDIPNFTSLRVPVDERVRLELSLAEAAMVISPDNAQERFWKTYNEVKDLPLDTDISCYCYVRFLISIPMLKVQDGESLAKELEKKLEDEFIRLIETSAEQLDISKKILRALSIVKPKLSLTFADLLNTVKRREQGVSEVLLAYMQQDRLMLDTNVLDEGFSKVFDETFRSSVIVKLLLVGNKTKKLNNLSVRDYFVNIVKTIVDPALHCQALTQLIIAYNQDSDKNRRAELFESLLASWQKIDIQWLQTEAAFDLSSRIAEVDTELANLMYQSAVTLRETSSLANQTIGTMFFETLLVSVKTIGFIDIQLIAEKQIWNDIFQLIDQIPSRLLKCYIVSKIALARLYKRGDKETFDNLVQDYVLREIQLSAPSDLKNRMIANISLAIYEYSPEEAFRLVEVLPYNQRNIALANITARALLRINIGEAFDEDAPNVSIDVQRANKAMAVIEKIDHDEYFSISARIIANSVALESSYLNEQQRLDLLTKLDVMVDRKLPDIKNIGHTGYKVLTKTYIETAKRLSAKKSKHLIKRNHNQIVQDARKIKNIADRVLVVSMIAREFRNIENDLADTLIDEAFGTAEKIPNTKDRIDRLEVIAQSYRKLNNTSGAEEAIRLGVRLSKSLEGLSRDAVLASLIQTAHQLDKTIASEISEKVEDPKMWHDLEVKNIAHDLAKAPHKLLSQFAEVSVDNDILGQAVVEMLKTVVSKRSGSFTDNTILDWMISGSHIEYETSLKITEWVSDVTMLQCPETARSRESAKILETIIKTSQVIYGIGNQILPLIKIPENIKANFQGLSISKELFRVGERNRAVSWIRNWLQSNAKTHVSICDPYFDETQMWILQCIPADVNVKIISSGKGFDFVLDINDTSEIKKDKRNKAKMSLTTAWDGISDQSCPPTFVVIHNSVYEGDKDKFHDRYIVTDGGGISIGTSLNGLGKQESFITILKPDDAKYVEDLYITPKLSVDKFFSRVIYFELGE